jgi:hypothetical protein
MPTFASGCGILFLGRDGKSTGIDASFAELVTRYRSFGLKATLITVPQCSRGSVIASPDSVQTILASPATSDIKSEIAAPRDELGQAVDVYME